MAHENLGVLANLVLGRGLAAQLAEVVSIELVNGDRAAIDATLGGMKRVARKLEAWTAWTVWHAASLAPGDQPTQPGDRRDRGRPPGHGIH